MRLHTKGETMAGIIPKRTSEKRNHALERATTVFAVEQTPTPPPMHPPFTRHNVGIRRWSNVDNIVRSFMESALIPSSFMLVIRNGTNHYAAVSFIQDKSAPAQNVFPLPFRMSPRIVLSSLTEEKALDSSAIVCAENAFFFSGLFSTRVATESSSTYCVTLFVSVPSMKCVGMEWY